MSNTHALIDSFHSFAIQRIHSGGNQLSIDELFDAWRLENPMPDEYAENVAAVNASIEDFKNGERGSPAGDHSSELRRQYNIGDA